MLPAMVEQERREKLRRVSTEKLIHRVSDRVDASHHGPVLMPDEGPSKTSTLLAAGAISGGVSKLLTAPIDRIKIIYQVNTDPRHAFTLRRGFSTASSIVLQSGVLALWRGNSAAVARDVPYASIVFASYAMYEDAVLKASGVTSGAASGGSVWSRLVAGSAAGATATFLTYPLDVMRARLAADSRSHHHGYMSGVRHLWRNEGPRGLYAGLRPTILGILPYSGLSFSAFETLKAHLRDSSRTRAGGTADDPLPPLTGTQRLLAGGAAGAIAQTVTYPLTVVRRRMQVGVGGGVYHGVAHALRSIYAAEGVANGLFKGLSLALLKGPLQSAIGFSVNDYAKKRLAR